MAFDVQEFKKEFQKKFEELFAYGYESGSKTEQYIALGDLVRGLYSDDWIQTVTDYNKKRKTSLLLFHGIPSWKNAEKQSPEHGDNGLRQTRLGRAWVGFG